MKPVPLLLLSIFSLLVSFSSIIIAEPGPAYSIANGNCVIQDGFINENGRQRPLTAEERSKLSQYRADWKNWRQEFSEHIKSKFRKPFPFNHHSSSSASAAEGDDSSSPRKPKTPRFPCICSGCTQPTDDTATDSGSGGSSTQMCLGNGCVANVDQSVRGKRSFGDISTDIQTKVQNRIDKSRHGTADCVGEGCTANVDQSIRGKRSFGDISTDIRTKVQKRIDESRHGTATCTGSECVANVDQSVHHG